MNLIEQEEISDMNALKKLLSVLLVACMALSVCAVSFAEGNEALPRVAPPPWA